MLPNLPMNCWGNIKLSRVGSLLVCPIYADECTTSTERISHAQILVEMDVTRALPNMIKVQDPNVTLQKGTFGMAGTQKLLLAPK